MNNVIIGTAGHVDHGKTSLIRALTGIDADRLKEEKERGITIELGFAYLVLPNGERCGIIDVPGHEKFVRNMLSGAGSVDLALFVVAGDEGMMPQSREHLEILSLLGIKRGIIAITKSDILEKDWIEMVAMDIADAVKGTFLENAQIIPVSAKTGEGIEQLKKSLFDMIMNTENNSRDAAPFRLQIDRVFTKEGFGTVVTGTLIDGMISVGEEIILYPAMLPTKTRTIQVHSTAMQTAIRGQRVAVNLSGIKTSDIYKGCVLAKPDSIRNSDLLDVRLDIVKSTKRKILNNSRLHLYHGTGDTTCKLVIFGKEELKAGESCYAQLRCDEPIATRCGDRFVVRFYSPMETVGGGVILDSNPSKRNKNDSNAVEICKIKEKGNLKERISCFVWDRSATLPLIKNLKMNPFQNEAAFDKELQCLINEKEVFVVRDAIIHKTYLAVLLEKSREILSEFHRANPLLEGMKKEELRSKLFAKEFTQYFDSVLAVMEEASGIRISGNYIANADFSIIMTDSHKKMSDEIEKAFIDGGFITPSLDEIAARYLKEQKVFKQTIDALVSKGLLVMLTSQIILHNSFLDKAIEHIRTYQREFTLAEFRDGVATSRKYAVAVLEYFDNKNITKKQGDFRILDKKYISP